MNAAAVIERYLRAAAVTPPPMDLRAVPAAHKRYPAEGRVPLPWEPWSQDGADRALGAFLRDLLGVRVRWAHPVAEDGLPTGAAPGVFRARPAPSGGGMYPIEAYVARADGLWHYDAAHHCLDLIRPGDHRTAIAGRPGAELVLVLTAVFWRTGFRYGEFAYRLQCQETGALLAQAVALAGVLGLAPAVRLHFADQVVQELLGPDPEREGPLALVTFGDGAAPGPAAADLLATPARTEISPPPARADRIPEMLALHAAAARRTGPGTTVPTGPDGLVDGVARRQSAPGGYRPEPLDRTALTTVLAAAGEDPALHVVVNRVGGVAPGTYRWDRDELVRTAGSEAVAAIARGPLHPGTRRFLTEAAAALIPVGDPLAGVEEHGERWYRIQQIGAGMAVHRAVLAATALGLGSRIHSDGTGARTDAALGLPPYVRSLSFLLLGLPRPGHTLRLG